MAINKTPDFGKMADELINSVASEVADYAQMFFKSSFDNQGFTDVSFIPWILRMDPSQIHLLLMKSSALKDSISITEKTQNLVEITAGEGIPYADIHNSGGAIQVRVTEKMRKFYWRMFYISGDIKWKRMALTNKDSFIIDIPQRQFIGDSAKLLEDIDRIIINRIQNIEKKI